jgi:hypothetical protein
LTIEPAFAQPAFSRHPGEMGHWKLTDALMNSLRACLLHDGFLKR